MHLDSDKIILRRITNGLLIPYLIQFEDISPLQTTIDLYQYRNLFIELEEDPRPNIDTYHESHLKGICYYKNQ